MVDENVLNRCGGVVANRGRCAMRWITTATAKPMRSTQRLRGLRSCAQEVCDGMDNDCDGQTDEGQLNACGECGDAPIEVCDGMDNDCDGQTDEETEQACGIDVGACTQGTSTCINGEYGACMGGVQPPRAIPTAQRVTTSTTIATVRWMKASTCPIDAVRVTSRARICFSASAANPKPAHPNRL